MSESVFVRARGGDRAPRAAARWFIFRGREVLLQETGDGLFIPLARSAPELGLDVLDEPLYIGHLDGVPCMAASLAEEAMPKGYVTDVMPKGYAAKDLRTLYGLVDEATWAIAGLAFQLTYWAENTRYCPRTGDRTHLKLGEWAMACPTCDLLQYPHVSPCIIVLVRDGDRMLLTRQPGWATGRYGLVAGFVEPNETLEECVAREVREETGLAVDEIEYVSSQAWPFPHQLMVGFTARYAGGELVVDHTELEDAAWFPIDNPPILPPKPSIARRILDAHLDNFAR